MPLNPALAEGFHLLDGIPSLPAGLADPELRIRMDAFLRPAPSPSLPDVDIGREHWAVAEVLDLVADIVLHARA